MNEKQVLEELNGLGSLIVNKEWHALDTKLSQWLRDQENFKEDILTSINEMIDDWALSSSSWPSAVEPDINPITELDEVSEYFSKKVDPNLNNENFAAWGCIQLVADEEEELDAYADIWVLLYNEHDELKIGYYEIEYPD